MTDPIAYLEQLSGFTAFLRANGIPAGLRETADAGSLLAGMDLSDRGKVKDVLMAVYACSQQEQELFNRCFDRYFVTEEQRKILEQQELDEARKLEELRQQAEKDFEGRTGPMDIPEELMETYVRMPEEVREKLRKTKDSLSQNNERSPGLYDGLIRSIFMRTLLEQQMMMEDAAAHAEAFTDPELDLLYREISEFKDHEIPQAIQLILRIRSSLEGELRSRRKKAGQSSRLDFKKTIRKGLETGGVLYRLAYRKKHSRKRQLVMLCDISGSMLRFSQFALTFIQSMSSVSDYSLTFLFSEDLFEADVFAMQSAESFIDYVKSTGLYGKGTNLAVALEKLMESRPPILGPGTTLLILSDTKSVEQERTEALLREAVRKCGDVIWLNPIPERKWRFLRSVERMSAICRMLPCSNLNELARACRRLAV